MHLSKHHLRRYPKFAGLLAILAGATCPSAQAQFALAVSPPRLELTAQAGQQVRQVIELTHSDPRPGTYRIRTADWTLKPDGSVEFSDALAPGSCRPWVAIERREITITAGKPYRFRFEVAPPADAPPTECRFAILIEGKEQPPGPGMPMAMSARIGVITYVAIGDVAPALELAGSAVQAVEGKSQAVLKLRNTGNAHGRVSGFLSGTDASGTKLDFQPGTTPIMPGETRDIALIASKPGNPDTPVAVRFPVTVTGTLEWGAKGSLKINQQFAP